MLPIDAGDMGKGRAGGPYELVYVRGRPLPAVPLVAATAGRRETMNEIARSREEENRPVCYRVVVRVRTRRDLPEGCMGTLLRHRVFVRTLSIMRAEGRPGWRDVILEVRAASREVVVAMANELAGEGQPVIATTARLPATL